MSNIAPRITYPSYKRPDPDRETSRSTEAGPSDLAGLFQLWIECQITRRKRYSQIVDPSGETVYIDRNLANCIAYLEQESQHAYILITETSEFLVRLERLEGKRRTQKWQK